MFESGRETFPDVREWSGGPPECPGVVGRPSRMSERGLETLPDVRGDQGALMDVQQWSEVSPECREWSNVSPGCPRVVRRRSQMSVSGRKALPEVWDWWGGPLRCTGGPPKCQEVVGRPSQMFGSGREALPNVWEWSGGFPGCPGVVERPSRMFERGLEALPDVQGDQGALSDVREW